MDDNVLSITRRLTYRRLLSRLDCSCEKYYMEKVFNALTKEDELEKCFDTFIERIRQACQEEIEDYING